MWQVYWITSSASRSSRWGHRDPERLGSLEVEDELELHGLLHGQVRGLGAFENLVYVGGGMPQRVHGVRPIRHEAARHHPLSPGVQYGQPMRGGEGCDAPSALTIE